MKNKTRKSKAKFNVKVVIQSLIGLACLGLAFFVHWIFILGCAIVIYLNQRELFREE